MKLKYYLRGLGIGIIVTTILLMIAFALHKPTMSDADIIARAKQLGMVMPEDEEPLQDTETTESTEVTAVPETEAAQIEEQATEAAEKEGNQRHCKFFGNLDEPSLRILASKKYLSSKE